MSADHFDVDEIRALRAACESLYGEKPSETLKRMQRASYGRSGAPVSYYRSPEMNRAVEAYSKTAEEMARSFRVATKEAARAGQKLGAVFIETIRKRSVFFARLRRSMIDLQREMDPRWEEAWSTQITPTGTECKRIWILKELREAAER